MAPPRNKPQDRADQTRQALLEAGIALFARDGYDGVSNRTLAATAGTNQALISYHFGSKEGLYKAVFEHIAAQVSERMSETMASTREQVNGLKEKLTQIDEATRQSIQQSCMEIIAKVVRTFAGFLLAPTSENFAKLVLQEQMNPTKAIDVLSKIQREILDLLSDLIAVSKMRTKACQQDRLTALTIVGQVLVFRHVPETVNRLMDWEKSDADAHIEDIVAVIENNARQILS